MTNALPNRTLVAGGGPFSIDLRGHLGIPAVTGTVAQFDTVLGKFNIELLAADAPKTVENFLKYIADASYTNTIVHRSAALTPPSSNRILQGGGYNTSMASITRKAPIVLEYKLPNTRGTIAMARTSEANSATSEWFLNVDDNSSALGAANNGGYAVFGRVLGTGMTVVDAIAAVPTYNAQGAFTTIPLRDMQPGQTNVLVGNLIVVNSIKTVPVHPSIANPTGVLTLTATSSNLAVVTTEISGSTLTLRPLATGTANVTVRAADTNGQAAESTFSVTIASGPTFTAHPGSQTIVAGQSGTLTQTSAGATSYQWQRNGRDLSGITAAAVNLTDMQPSIAGLYTVRAANGNASAVSTPAIVGVSTTSKVIGAGTELTPVNIPHPNGNIFDQVLLTGAAEAITADPGQVTRTSFIDLDDDIVQVEFAGPGTLSILMYEATGPAVPTKYNQPSTQYVRGHASIVITGATKDTHVSVFTVGRATAFDPTGAYDLTKSISTSNDPAKNGSPLFQGHAATAYDGIADISRIAIRSTDGQFGSIRVANAYFWDVAGHTGIYAPGVTVVGPVRIGDISAYKTDTTSATPVLILGGIAAGFDCLITGGDLHQDNGQPLQVSGIAELKFVDGSDSHGRLIPAKKNDAILFQNGQNVTP